MECACGHVWDEYDDGRECQAVVQGDGQEEPCPCVHFDEFFEED